MRPQACNSLRIRRASSWIFAAVSLVLPVLAFAQVAPSSSAPSPASPAGPLAPSAAAAATTTTSASSLGAAASAPLQASPQDAVRSILGMFTPNDLVNVAGTSKPLSATGSWGVQGQFAGGPPKVCVQNQVPCVRVVYRVPEVNIVCDWTVGFLVAVEREADGSMKHVLREVVLDENDAAATYTVKKSWAAGEVRPKLVAYRRADYPEIARNANVSGVVTVRLMVGPDGVVQNAAAIGGPPLLQKPVLEAVRQWKFAPQIVGDRAISFRSDQSFSFDVGRPNYAEAADPASGQVVLGQTDPHYSPGFHSTGTAGQQWESCSAVTCVEAAAPTPK